MELDKQLLDQASFLKKYGLTEEEFGKTGLSWQELEQIYCAHIASAPHLRATADYMLQRLRELSAIHSLKMRIKHPEHLVEKIIRKRLEKPDLDISLKTYQKHITDLIGLRALHLFKDQWEPIHDFVIRNWEPEEKPVAYVRKGDPDEVLEAFTKSGCDVKEHVWGYRSVHYLLKSQPSKEIHLAELQVRTLFEEAWSEIDHLIRYPRISEDPRLAQFLVIFNRLAGSADEMASFIKALSKSLQEEKHRLEEMRRQLESKEVDLKKTISQLQISKAEKKKLEEKVESLTSSSHTSLGAGILATDPLTGTSNYSGLLGLGTTLGMTSTSWSNAGLGNILQRTCARCGKQYQHDISSSSLLFTDRCPDCVGKYF